MDPYQGVLCPNGIFECGSRFASRGQQLLRLSPVDAFHQYRQLRWRQEHFAITGRRPGEAAAFKSFRQQKQTIAGGPEQFDLTATAFPEDKDVTRHRVIFQWRLYFFSKAVEAISHVGNTGSQILVPEGRRQIIMQDI